MGRASLILFAVTAITVSAIFIHSDVQADGFSAGRVFTDVLAALFWSGLGIVGTFYLSIPAATLIVVAFRLAYRRLRNRRSRGPAEPPVRTVQSSWQVPDNRPGALMSRAWDRLNS